MRRVQTRKRVQRTRKIGGNNNIKNLESLFPSFPEKLPEQPRPATSLNAIKAKMNTYKTLRNKPINARPYRSHKNRMQHSKNVDEMLKSEKNIYSDIETLRTIPEIALTNDERNFLAKSRGVKYPAHLRSNFNELIKQENLQQEKLKEQERLRELIRIAKPLIQNAYNSYLSRMPSQFYASNAHPKRNYFMSVSYDNFSKRRQDIIDAGVTNNDMVKIGLKELAFLLDENTKPLALTNEYYLHTACITPHGCGQPKQWSYYEPLIRIP